MRTFSPIELDKVSRNNDSQKKEKRMKERKKLHIKIDLKG